MVELRASIVLDDCRYVLELLQKETTDVGWRVHWAGGMALIRAVGAVLYRESSSNEALEKIVKARFRDHLNDKQGHRIYWEFIKVERDQILKEYTSIVYDSDVLMLGIIQREKAYPFGSGDYHMLC